MKGLYHGITFTFAPGRTVAKSSVIYEVSVRLQLGINMSFHYLSLNHVNQGDEQKKEKGFFTEIKLNTLLK